MENYKVLIVDDEEEVRQGIVECVPWEECGFIVSGEAANGIDALEIAETVQPDLVITDIKMPYMEGLQFTKQLSKISPTSKIVIITGFDDFNYAKQAISLNVLEYIIKPINLNEMKVILKNIKKAMDHDKESLRDFEFLKEHYVTSLPVLKENFLVSLLEGRITTKLILEKLKIFEIAVNPKYALAGCLRIDFGDQSKGYNKEHHLLLLSTKKIADDILAKHIVAHTITYTDYIVVICFINDKNEVNNLINALDEICKVLELIYHLTATAGIGYVVHKLSLLHRSYKGALVALDYRMILGSGKAIFISDIEPNSGLELSFEERNEQLLLSALRRGDSLEIETVVKNLLELCDDIRLPYQKYQIYIFEILNSILRLARSFNIEIKVIFGEDFYPINKISSFESREELTSWLITVCINVANHIKVERAGNSSRIVSKAKEYAQNNYKNSDFSIDGMCKELFVSTAYFSTLFKKETGVAFVHYISELRLLEAKRLLLETDLKSYIIAEKVGFVDPNYFSFVFKKTFNISPTKFRSGVN